MGHVLALSFHGLRSLVAGTIVYDAGSRSSERLSWGGLRLYPYAGLYSQTGRSCWSWSVDYGAGLDRIIAHGLFASWAG